jgi:hypothetical protein
MFQMVYLARKYTTVIGNWNEIDAMSEGGNNNTCIAPLAPALLSNRDYRCLLASHSDAIHDRTDNFLTD